MAVLKACPTCGRLGCEQHKRTPWQDRPKHRTGLSGWQQQQRAQRVIRRDNGICHVCGQPGADQADHVVPLSEGGADGEDQMRAIHETPCHERKTQAEALRARMATHTPGG